MNRNRKYCCDRLGAACDFLIVELESDRLIDWVLEKTNYLLTRCISMEAIALSILAIGSSSEQCGLLPRTECRQNSLLPKPDKAIFAMIWSVLDDQVSPTSFDTDQHPSATPPDAPSTLHNALPSTSANPADQRSPPHHLTTPNLLLAEST